MIVSEEKIKEGHYFDPSARYMYTCADCGPLCNVCNKHHHSTIRNCIKCDNQESYCPNNKTLTCFNNKCKNYKKIYTFTK